MNPDPYTSGEVGLITGLLLYILFAWIFSARKRRISKIEEKIFNIFAFMSVYLALLPLHLMFGILIIGTAVLISPYIEPIIGIDIKGFVKNYIWVDSEVSSLIWTVVIGALPSFFGFYQAKNEDK